MARRCDKMFDIFRANAATSTTGHAADKVERETPKKYGNKKEIGLDTSGQGATSWEDARGRSSTQTNDQSLAEAKMGEMNAAAQHKRLRAAIERTTVRAEADALTAASTHEESSS